MYIDIAVCRPDGAVEDNKIELYTLEILQCVFYCRFSEMLSKWQNKADTYIIHAMVYHKTQNLPF